MQYQRDPWGHQSGENMIKLIIVGFTFFFLLALHNNRFSSARN